MATKLYVVQGSHPCMTARAALRLKGIDFKEVELPELVHIPHQRLRFGGPSVPSVRFDDGTKVLGSRPILRALDERAPDPPLLPADPDRRARVLELEEWGDEFQGVPRRLIFWGLKRDPAAFPSYTVGSRWRMPGPVYRALGPGIARAVMRVHDASDDTTRADLDALPGQLARIRAAIDDGTIGGDPPNAADLQLGASVRLLTGLEDVRAMVESAGLMDWVMRLYPEYEARMPAGTYPV